MSWDSLEFWITDDRGVRIVDERGVSLITKALWLELSFKDGDVGWFRMGLPASFDTSLIEVDRMIQIWRAPKGGRLGLLQPFFIRYWKYETRGSQQLLTIGGPDQNDLLSRRIIAYASEEDQADKQDNADDMMKEIVDENMVTDVSIPDEGDRDYANLSIEPDFTDGPILIKAFAWRNVLSVLQDLQAASKEAGTEVFFSIDVDSVDESSISFIFRTKTGQPGQDLTSLGVVFDQERGNLIDPFLEFDWRQEANYIYAGGQGERDDRYVAQAADSTRYNLSQWNRREVFRDSRHQDDDDKVDDDADVRLTEGLPRRRFGGNILDVEGMRFGSDWSFGDKVKARYRGEEFNCIIKALVLRVDGSGYESIQARLEFEE